MDCPKCGHTNKANAAVCSNCYYDLLATGKPVTQEPMQRRAVAAKPAQPAGPPPPVPTQAAPPPQTQPSPYSPGTLPPAPQPQPSPYGPPPTGVATAHGAPGSFPLPQPILNYASFWQRAGASLIDGFLLGAVAMVFLAIVGMPDFSQFAPHTPTPGAAPAPPNPQAVNKALEGFLAAWTSMNMFLQAVSLFYYVGMNGSRGATLGKMALGLQIVKADGSPIGWGTAIGRYILESILSGMTCGITFLMVAFTQKKQGLHDMALGTIVITTR